MCCFDESNYMNQPLKPGSAFVLKYFEIVSNYNVSIAND